MDQEPIERLQALLALEKARRIRLDLKGVTLVGREAVEFLVRVEAAGVGLVNGPDYVRRWIATQWTPAYKQLGEK